MDSPSENIHEETESFPKIDSSKVESTNPFFTKLPEEPEILENRIDYEAVNLYRKYVNKLRTIRQRYLLSLIFTLAFSFIGCLIGASFYLSGDGIEIAIELSRFFKGFASGKPYDNRTFYSYRNITFIHFCNYRFHTR